MKTRNVEEILAQETEASEAGKDLDAAYVRNRNRGKDPSQVYSVRMPVDRLEELRVLAERSHMTPSALMRRLAIEGLDRAANVTSHVGEPRDDLASGNEHMIVMTPEQFKEVIHEAIEMTASEVLKPLLEVVKTMQEKNQPAA